MSKRVCYRFVAISLSGLVAAPQYALAASPVAPFERSSAVVVDRRDVTVAVACPSDDKDGLNASVCQIGNRLQVLAFNSNSYEVRFTVKVTYRLNHGDELSKQYSGQLGRERGTELGFFDTPRNEDRFTAHSIEIVRMVPVGGETAPAAGTMAEGAAATSVPVDSEPDIDYSVVNSGIFLTMMAMSAGIAGVVFSTHEPLMKETPEFNDCYAYYGDRYECKDYLKRNDMLFYGGLALASITAVGLFTLDDVSVVPTRGGAVVLKKVKFSSHSIRKMFGRFRR